MASSSSPQTLFATTRWTLVCEAASGGHLLARRALEDLFQTYWQPLYRYARRRGKSKEDAEDLVQGFLAHLMASGGLSLSNQEKGRFRTFLLSSFNHWMINDWKHANRLKRGGGVVTLSFDWESAETGLAPEIGHERSPDKLYDHEWALTLLGKVLKDLECFCAEEGNSAQFEALKSCLTTDSDRIPYASLAEELAMSEGALRVAVHRLRKRYRHLLTDEIARTLDGPEALEDEMQSLFAALAQ